MKRLTCLIACAAIGSAFATTTPADDDDDAKAPPPPRAEGSQQNKMKTCNADAKTKALKGDERRAFMSECLKKH